MLLYSTAKASNSAAFQITHTGYAIDMHSITIILCLHVSAQVKIATKSPQNAMAVRMPQKCSQGV